MGEGMRIDWKGWLGWLVATMAGVELVLLIFYWVVLSPLSDVVTWAEDAAIIGLVGTVFGTMQWICLRRRMSNAGWWISATVIGWYLAVGSSILGEWHAIDSIVQRFGRVSEIVRACSFPVALSLPQWFLLRRHFRRAGYWIVARLIGWLAGIGLVVLAEELHVIGSGFFLANQ